MTEEKYLDIIEFLLSQKGQNLLGSDLKSKLFRQKLVLQCFFRGEASLKEVMGHLRKTLWNNLPSFLKSFQGPVILKNDLDLIDRLILRCFFNNYPLNPVKVLDCEWHYLLPGKMSAREKYLSFFSIAETVKIIAITDQYCAKEFIKDNAIVIDVGANIGIFSLFARSLAPNGKIYSFEPLSQIFDILQRNISGNNLEKKILPFQKAMGWGKKETKLFLRDRIELYTGSAIEDSDITKGREKLFSNPENVQMTSIDSFVDENKVECVNFIKIDTEGYEKQVIKGAENTIKKFSPTIVCSAYHLEDDKTKIPSLIESINPNYKHRLEKRAEEVLVFWVNK